METEKIDRIIDRNNYTMEKIDNIIDHSHLIKEYPRIFHMIAGIRKNGNSVEIGVDTTCGIQWFHYSRASIPVEKQIKALIKLGEI